MSSIAAMPSPVSATLEIQQAVESACNRIAPVWPLDQSIAVNPYWGFIETPIHATARELEIYAGSRMVMPRSFYREQWNKGAFGTVHLQEALHRLGLSAIDEEVVASLEHEPYAAPRVPLMTSMADDQRDLVHGMSICDFVTHNVSQHCASYFDQFQSSWESQHHANLYHGWLRHACADRSPRLLMGIHCLRDYARTLPDEPMALVEYALTTIPVPQEMWPQYLLTLLMSINGWASWCAYQRWQARLAHRDDDHIIQLLAIRLAWDHFAFVHLLGSKEPSAWSDAWKNIFLWQVQSEHSMPVEWICQEALEYAYQSSLCRILSQEPAPPSVSDQRVTAVQAVFCIDVRSEVYRRALENCSHEIRTLGFAGFFGLPILYTPLGADAGRPQLPGLLAPSLHVSQSTGSQKEDRQFVRRRKDRRLWRSILKDFRTSASSTFTFVESCGLFYAAKLLGNRLLRLGRVTRGEPDHSKSTTLRPCPLPRQGDPNSSREELCDLVAGVLRNMSLTTNFARIVLLVGHGSQSANNPHASNLDCGACGGQTGEVNVRVFASLLNDNAIRAGILPRGIEIPATTHFLPALHNTTTDQITILDTDQVPLSHAGDRMRLQNWLQEASHRARRERAGSLGIKPHSSLTSEALLRQFQLRSCDWSQVRPEWGLANNAAFLIAPRSRSLNMDLQGRVFLHEYQSADDPDGSVLEAIMTAPMLVTNWINMQYYASTVDNRLYGCGNKVLHNVVGGRIGVFEGNGGDLRIGLPLQSLHDGNTLRHTPLRLSVFIEAPRRAISRILGEHQVVENLVNNSWLHLFQIEPGTNILARYTKQGWQQEKIVNPISGNPRTDDRSSS